MKEVLLYVDIIFADNPMSVILAMDHTHYLNVGNIFELKIFVSGKSGQKFDHMGRFIFLEN